MSLSNVKFIVSAPDKSQWIEDDLQEFVVLGRSNVGKSTFINNLANTKQLAKVSATPGRTRLLNFFDVNGLFRLVDAPGYGFAGVMRSMDKAFGSMMEEYFNERKNLSGAILLLDSRRIPNQDDQQLFRFLIIKEIPFILVATKCDKLNQSEKTLLRRNFMLTLNLPLDTPLILSSQTSKGWIEEVIAALDELLESKV